MTTETNAMTSNNIQKTIDGGIFFKLLGILLFLLMFALTVVSFSKTLNGVVYSTNDLSQKINLQSVKIQDVESKQQKDMLQLLDNDDNIAHQVKVQQVQLYEQKLQLLSQEDRIKVLEQSFSSLLKSHQFLMRDNLYLHSQLNKIIE